MTAKHDGNPTEAGACHLHQTMPDVRGGEAQGSVPLDRRTFLQGSFAGLGTFALGSGLLTLGASALAAAGHSPTATPEYCGPNVIVVRFGGGARRHETISETQTWSPYLRHELTRRGTLFPMMEIASLEGVETGHGQGTLNILTGAYDRYTDVDNRFLGERFEPRVPTMFEYLRKAFAVPEHQTLIINGEDRIDEEFYAFSNHHLYGVEYASNVLSLFRYKTHLLRRQLEEGVWGSGEFRPKRRELKKMEAIAGRAGQRGPQSPQIERFWDNWRAYYGETGLVNPRGDRLLTELAIRAIRELGPKLMMIHYQDCDYVHWGNMNHYTRGIQVMDEGLHRLVEATEAHETYRDNTVFVIVPDCGRDESRLAAVPCQHHFTRSSREIFALMFGPGVSKGVVVDRRVEQIDVAPTIAAVMGFKAAHAEGRALEEAFS